EPPRFYPLVPETSASTNSATWAGASRAFSGPARAMSMVSALRTRGGCPGLAGEVGDPPQVESGIGPVRPPALAARGQFPGRGHLPGLVHQLRALADAQVVDREHVGAPETEHQHHFHGPAADAADGHQRLDDRVVLHHRHAPQVGDLARLFAPRQVAQREQLVAGNPAGADGRVIAARQGVAMEAFAADGFLYPADDGRRGLAAELLVEDRP